MNLLSKGIGRFVALAVASAVAGLALAAPGSGGAHQQPKQIRRAAQPGHAAKLAGRKLSASAQKKIRRQLALSHMAFVQNAGQWNPEAKFRAQAPGLDMWLGASDVTFDYHRQAKRNGKSGREGQVVRMRMLGAQDASSFEGALPRAYRQNYFTGRKAHGYAADVYGEVTAKNLYPGVDMRSYYDGGKLRYDFVVRPGADASKIRLGFDGASRVAVKNGDLAIGTQLGDFVHGKLYAYQTVGGAKVRVPAAFKATNGVVTFELGKFDPAKTLVIDPVVYGTYFGGDNGWDDVRCVSADQNGNVFMTGSTQATLFPVTAGPYFYNLAGAQNAFVARLQGDAYNIDYAALFGGSNVDYGQQLQVDQYGNVWIAGVTTSPDFPGNTKTNTGPTVPDIFVIRFQSSTTEILDPLTNPITQMIGYDGTTATTTMLNGFAIVPDPNPGPSDPVLYSLVGQQSQATPEVTTGSFAVGGTNFGVTSLIRGFVLSESVSGTTITPTAAACQYIGEAPAGSFIAVDMGGLAVDSQGNEYIAGDVGDGANNYDTTVGNVFTTTGSVFTGGRLLQKTDLFARKYAPDGTLTYSCVIGGSSNESIGGRDTDQTGAAFMTGSAVAIDPLGDAYVTGDTTSFDYPRTRGAYGEVFDAFQNVVVTKLNSDASGIIYSTNLKVIGLGEPNANGQSSGSSITPAGISVDQAGEAYITGNIDPRILVWPGSGAPDDPTNYYQGGIQTGADGTDAPLSTTYTSPTPPKLPTSEPWLNVLDATGSTLIYGTYLGGNLDDKVWAPYVDPFGDVWVFGWTDSLRVYIDPATMAGVVDTGALPTGMVTAKAFKHTGDAALGMTGVNGVWWSLLGGGLFDGPTTISFINEARDGFLAKFSIGQPIVSQVNVAPSTLPGGLGASATCNIVLSSAAPPQGATVTMTLLDSQYHPTSFASFDANDSNTTMTVTVPGGATTLPTPLTIYSSAVTSPQQVLVKAFYQGNFLIAPLTVVPWLQNFTLTPPGVVGGNPVTGTIVLAAAAPNGGITVQIQSSSPLAAPPTSVTIPAGQTSASFPVTTSGVDSESFPVITVSLLGFGIAQPLELDPASILSVVLTPTRVSGETTITGVVTLNGLPGPNFPQNSGTYQTTVSVVGSPAGYVVAPASLLFEDAKGNPTTTASFTVTTPYVNATQTQTVQVTRPAVPGTGYTLQQSNSIITVDPTPLTGFTLDKNTANPGDTRSGTLSVSTPADQGGAVVAVTASPLNIVSFSSPQVIPSGSTGITFPILVGSSVVTQPTDVTLTATRGTTQLVQVLHVSPSTMTFVLDSNSVLGGNTVHGVVTISNPAPTAGLPIKLTFNPNSGAATAVDQNGNPVGDYIIHSGDSSVDVYIKTTAQTTTQELTVTAAPDVAGATISASQPLEVRAPGLLSITFSPPNVVGLRTTVMQITLDGPAPAGGLVVNLTSSNPAVANIPPSLTIKAGATSVMQSIFARRVSRPIATTVTAKAGGHEVSTVLTVLRF